MHKIIICLNAETICDGYVDTDDEFASKVADAATDVLASHPRREECDYDYDRIFRNWHGGKYARAGERVAGKRYGYHSYKVATLEVDPPEWLCELIDEMSYAMENTAQQLAD